jgi:hypothetical protein
MNGNGTVTIDSTGVAQPISAASLAVIRLDIRALKTNSDDIIIGGDTIVTSPVNGMVLHPDEAYNLSDVVDLRNVYINGTAGDVIVYTWWNAYVD